MTSHFRDAWSRYGYSLFSMRKSPQVSDQALPGFDKVPSTPLVSIEISLTNKNRLVVLFTQRGCYFVESLYLHVYFQGSLFLSPGFIPLFIAVFTMRCNETFVRCSKFIQCVHELMEKAFQWFVSIVRIY